MSQLPSQFSQSALQDYVDCARRFELKYIQKMRWPAAESEPIELQEAHMRRGALFHQMIHLHHLGVPPEQIATTEMDDDLRLWWQAYLESDVLQNLPQNRYPEYTLSVPLAGRRLIAKYDLLAYDQSRGVIVDWKTSLWRTKRAVLEQRLQTVVYRYVAVAAGVIPADQLTMIYWFAAHPEDIAILPYSQAQYSQDEHYLTALLQEIEKREVFDLTVHVNRCFYCVFRSLCERGVSAGDFEGIDEIDIDDDAFDLDFDQVAEVVF
ncbi:MAG: PD-(D/E)XK nuclease family protein [Phototrophicales bacterium]